jgi:Amidohydrolase
MSLHPPVIDVHTHVFNARYLPLKNVFLSFLGKPKWYKKAAAAAAARVIEEATGSSYQGRLADIEPDDEIWERVETELESRTRGFMVAAGDRPKADYAADRLETDPLFGALVELEQLLILSGDDPDSPSAEDPSDRSTTSSFEAYSHAARRSVAHTVTAPLVRGAAIEGMFDRFEHVVKWAWKKLWAWFDKAMVWWDSLRDFRTFVRRLMMAEREILSALITAYGSNDVRFVHHMMDMEYAYTPSTPARYPFDEQLKRMRRLADDSGGRLWGFTAFDPRRQEEFSMPDGFAGVKFYPAMGYRPWGDPDDDVRAAVEKFHEYCEKKKVPVFTHCTPRGFQARKGFGVNAHPKYWAQALDKHPLLRLCLGHAGGGAMTNKEGNLYSPGWYAANSAPATKTCSARSVTSTRFWKRRSSALLSSRTSSASGESRTSGVLLQRSACSAQTITWSE